MYKIPLLKLKRVSEAGVLFNSTIWNVHRINNILLWNALELITTLWKKFKFSWKLKIIQLKTALLCGTVLTEHKYLFYSVLVVLVITTKYQVAYLTTFKYRTNNRICFVTESALFLLWNKIECKAQC